MPMKINKLEIENVKRVKAVKIEPNQNGLTIDVYKRQQYGGPDCNTLQIAGNPYKMGLPGVFS